MSRFKGVTWYFVEGETEEYFVKSLIQGRRIPHGSVYRFNCWHNSKIESVVRRFRQSQKNRSVVIFDTDDLSNIDLFIKNMVVLKKHSNDLRLAAQVLNFEEELIRACNNLRNASDLCNVFGANGINNFKRRFIADQRALEKIIAHEFDTTKIWVSQVPAQVEQRLRGIGIQSQSLGVGKRFWIE